jgi:hypothetical protein
MGREEMYSIIRIEGEEVIMGTTKRQMKGKFIKIFLSLLPSAFSLVTKTEKVEKNATKSN